MPVLPDWTFTARDESQTQALGAAIGRALGQGAAGEDAIAHGAAGEDAIAHGAAGEDSLAHGAAGGLVALVGTLGAGKTRLVQAIAEALGANRRLVNSPTFILIQEYEASLPIYHCDTYRLRNVDEFLALGVDELFQSEAVCLIEWADRVAGVLPADHLRIEIDIAGATERRFRLAAGGPRSASVLHTARNDVERG